MRNGTFGTGANLGTLILAVLALLPAMTMALPTGHGAVLEHQTDLERVVDLSVDGNGIFIENLGQWDQAFRFRAYTSFGSIALSDEGIYYRIDGTSSNLEQRGAEGHVVKVTFVDAGHAVPVGSSPLETRFNYLLGNDREAWATDVRGYGSVVYDDLWPGIDLIYRGDGGSVKYDLVLDPWADPADVRMNVEGAQELRVIDGSLQMVLDDRTVLTDSSLKVFYEGGKGEIGASFTVDGTSYGFKLQGYDASRKVVIDPEVNLNAANFSTYIGGTNTDNSEGIDIGSDGAVFICGTTLAEDFPVTPGAYQVTKTEGWGTAFVLKLSSDGRMMKYCTYIGGSSGDIASAIHVTPSGSVVVAGFTGSEDFPITEDAYDDTLDGAYDVYVLELGPTGSTLLSSTFIGGEQSEGGPEIDVDGDGTVYVVSNTNSTRFPVTSNAYQSALSSGQSEDKRDLCLFVLDISEMDLIYSTYFGGNDWEFQTKIICRSPGTAYVSGYTCSADLDTTSSAYSISIKGTWDGFLFEMDTTTGDLMLSTYFGGTDFDAILGMDVDRSGNIYACGQTQSSDLPVTSSGYDRKFDGELDGFLMVMNRSGRALDSSSFIGGTDLDSLSSLELDPFGEVQAVGLTWSTDLPVQYKAFQTGYSGNNDAMYIKMDSDLTSLLYSTYIGGSGSEGWSSDPLISLVGSDGAPVVTGCTYSSDFPTTSGSYDTSYDSIYSDGDLFVTKLVPELPPGLPVVNRVLAGDSFVNLSWNIPVEDTGIEVLDFEVMRGTESGFLEPLGRSGGELAYNDTTVVNGRTYIYAVRGLNDMGPGLTSLEVSARPGTRPSMPRNLSGEHGDSIVQLTWDVPEDDGGWKVLHYTIVKRNSTDDEVQVMDDVKGTNFTDTDVMNGIAYDYTVTAVNDLGRSEPSRAARVTPLTVPGAPTGLTAVSGPGFSLLSWAAPLSNGGAPLTFFRVYRTYDEEWEMVQELGPATSECNDTGLTNGVVYTYRVSALNSEGESVPSDEVQTYPLDRPTCPMDLKAEPSDGSIALSWKEPSSDGGSPVQGYIVFRAEGSSWNKVQETPYNGLVFVDRSVQNGKNYRYRVCTWNVVGRSPFSTEADATPVGKPSAPKGLLAEAGDGYIILTWGEPNDGGSKVVSYNVQRQGPLTGYEPYAEVQGGVRSFNDTGVVNGRRYHYRVQAVNSVGASGLSDEVSAMPAGLSDPPSGLAIFRLTSGVQLEWESPSDTGGIELSGIRVYRGTTSTGLSLLAEVGRDVRSYRDSGTVSGRTYYYCLSSLNLKGEGPRSQVRSIVFATLPEPPQNVSAREMDGTFVVSWAGPGFDGGAEVVRYEVYRSEENGQWMEVARLGPLSLDWTDSNVTPGIGYRYKVRAVNEVGEGQFSSEVGVYLDLPGPTEGSGGSPIVLSIIALVVTLLVVFIGSSLVFVWIRSRRSRTRPRGPDGMNGIIR